MTRINTNIASLTARTNLYNNQQSLETSLQRLSTGLRINSGADDPSGLIAASVLGSEVVTVNQAITNSQRANNIVETADAALAQVSSLLNDIRGLVQASANQGAISSSEIAANQVQVDSAIESIDRIGQTTVFGGDLLLNGSKAFNIAGTLGNVFNSTADIQVSSFNPALHTGAPNSDVAVQINQSATQAKVNLVGFSNTAATGLNNLSLGTSTHATSTLLGVAPNAGSGLQNSIEALSVKGGANGTRATTTNVDITAAAFTGLAGAGTTTLTIGDNDITGASTTITLQNSSLNTGNAAAATYLATQINAVTNKTGVIAVAAGTNVSFNSLKVGGSATSIDLNGSGINALTTSNHAGGTVTVTAGTAVGAGTVGNLTTLSLTGSKNSGGSPVFVTFDNTQAINDSTTIVNAINARSNETGIIAKLGTDGIGGTSLGASVILTDTSTGSSSIVTANALNNGATGSYTTLNADATTLNSSETNVQGTTGTSNSITLQITGDLGQAVISVNNDAILNNSSALVGAINTVTSETGITASGTGVGGNVTLTSQDYGSNAKLSIQALSATNSADVTLFNGAATQQTTTGIDVAGTVTDGAGTGQFSGSGSVISYNDGSLAFTANTNPTLAPPTAATTTIAGAGGTGLSNLTASGTDTETLQLKVTGATGSATISVNVNDLKNDSRVLVDAINAVSTTTGVAASVTAGSGSTPYAGQNVVLTATNPGFASKVQITATGGTGTNEAANVTTFNTAANFTSTTPGANAPANTTAKFNVTGGALFQIGPEVNFQNQVNANITALDTHLLGRDSSTTGNFALHDLHTGGTQTLSSTSLTTAAAIVDQAISQIATLRGQLGALQANVLQSNIASQQTSLEQVTSAQSSIQDTDFAAETANLTRSQVLIQAGTSVLAIANSSPQSVLALLPRQ
ncbi:MAG TPA: flagellin [Pirellulales bacterium]|nr:flagellin [Pirellulales bacterium]